MSAAVVHPSGILMDTCSSHTYNCSMLPWKKVVKLSANVYVYIEIDRECARELD